METPVQEIQGTKRKHENDEETEEKAKEKKSLPKELTTMFEALECKLCSVKVETPIIALTHYRGRLHEKKVRAYMAERNLEYPSPPPNRVKTPFSLCHVCSVVLTSDIQARQHYAGKAHLKNLNKNQPSQTPSTPETPQPSAEFYCGVCDVPTTSADQLRKHNAGSRHLKRLKKNTLAEEQNRKDLALFRTPSDQYYCPRCNATSNSLEQFVQHMDSKRHKRNSKIKVIPEFPSS